MPVPDEAEVCDATFRPCQIGHDFGTRTLEADQELDGQCYSWTLNNPTELWVNGVELANDGAYHHSNWYYVPDTAYDRPDGMWECRAGRFREDDAAIRGGVLFAQSTQSTREVQQLLRGPWCACQPTCASWATSTSSTPAAER